MTRNPKAFEVWSTCSLSIHYAITELGMLPVHEDPLDKVNNFWYIDLTPSALID
jgi:hypothetical protein